MESHDFLDDDLRDTAVSFVLDALDEGFARTYRLHLKQCAVCRREVESIAGPTRDLSLIGPVLTPPPSLWNRVVERVRRSDPRIQPDEAPPASVNAPNSTQVWKGWANDAPRAVPDFTFLAAGDGSDFEPTAVAGIEARKLFVDAEGDRVTMMVRMRPGAAYPPHVHAAAEECFVLSGDLTVGSVKMRAGDYQRAAVGSTHGVQSTENGCVLLLVSSLHDELL